MIKTIKVNGKNVPVHKSITDDRVIDAMKAEMFGTENPGFCAYCGADHDACEPDAREYECYECGERGVFGAAEYGLRFL